MAVTWRFVVLVAAGMIPLIWWPDAAVLRIYWVGALALLFVDVALAPSPGALATRRDAVPPARVGETTRSRLTLTNPMRRRVRAHVRDAWQPSAGSLVDRHRVELHPGRSVPVEVDLVPSRRGDLSTDRFTVRVFGPLGLGARQRSFVVPGVLRALPGFPSRRHLPGLLAQWRQLDGRSAVRTRGQGTEFDSLRDYVEGDDVRSIDWRATARRRQVVVRTWQPERDRHVVIVVDTSRTSAGRIGDMPRLDSSMDAALLLSALASRAGDRVEVMMGDRDIHSHVRADRRGDLLNRLVNAMAPIDPALVEADWPRIVGAVSDRARRRALVVLVTPLEPAAVEESLLPVLPVLTSRHRVVIASVQDPSVERARIPLAPDAQAEMTTVQRSEAVYGAAAAEQTATQRARTAAVLQKLDVAVLDHGPEDLPLALCRHYLMLKSRGLL
ncbi:Uncharacterized conserved protein, DUF58 family, contains vWF domain [Austwickia chelonae]|uniref:DUF58 domain-containing protein n=1 Tax=Austwickia chelonae NBRC 105200 TaxID=1184607 RepID=K6VJ77_9MICO|nr:DUF58 domain-containing protein [Austwickia chelonae]GAB76789.1 hypothetical protein AUCHE_03_00060 [Austwickia chelonae NBRC 105200]SEW30739.1 Uncharacterized conserved protein, DUF58 family, contains vWF domain [Austwickia chelonae]